MGYAGQRRVAHKRRLGAPLGVYGNQLREVSNSVSLDVLPRGHAVDLDRPGRRTQIAEHHRDEGGLTRAVRSGDAEYLALHDHQRKLLDSFDRVAEEGFVS